MATFSVYFQNNYGSNQNYALFAESPVVASNTGNPTVYSNVFLSKNVANNSSWNISIAKTYYAYCGVSPSTLAPGVIVSAGSCMPVTLGTQSAPGTTWTMYNNAGSPAFQDQQTYTANPGSYEIDTGTDFTPNLNFVVGLGGIDPYGRQIPIATFEAPRNAKVNIQPVVKYYIASYNSSVGSVINTSTVGNAAVIDFTANPGMYAAIVTQGANGAYTVKYAPQAAFASFINAKAAAPAPEPMLSQLLQYLENMEKRLLTDRDNTKPGPSAVATQWACYADWITNNANTRTAIFNGMQHIATPGVVYNYTSGSNGASKLSAFFNANPQQNSATVLTAWQGAQNALAPGLATGIGNLTVKPNDQALDVGADDDDCVEEEITSPRANGNYRGQESIEDKKARALQLLASQGLTDVSIY